MTNKFGTVSWKARYYPFGELTYEWVAAATSNHIRFPGQYHDRETDLHYNWHRYYDPKTGRYLQPDPIGPAAGLNLYGYAESNPLIFVDPDGQIPILVLIWAGYEIGSTLWDLWELLQTLDNPCASIGEKSFMSAAFLGGMLLPGGGFGAAGKATARNFRKNLMKFTDFYPDRGIHAHHVFPREFEKRFRRIGIENIHLPQHGSWWEGSGHLSHRLDYNRAWDEFFAGGEVTAEDALQFARQLAKKYHLDVHF